MSAPIRQTESLFDIVVVKYMAAEVSNRNSCRGTVAVNVCCRLGAPGFAARWKDLDFICHHDHSGIEGKKEDRCLEIDCELRALSSIPRVSITGSAPFFKLRWTDFNSNPTYSDYFVAPRSVPVALPMVGQLSRRALPAFCGAFIFH